MDNPESVQVVARDVLTSKASKDKDIVDSTVSPASRTSNEISLAEQSYSLVHSKGLHFVSSFEQLPAADKPSSTPSDGKCFQPVYTEFAERDPRDPIHFSGAKKWVITIVACAFTFIVSANMVTYVLGLPSMERDLRCTSFQAAIGTTVYGLGFAFAPLFSAPLSEETGRHPLYIISAIGFAAMSLMSALSRNVQTIIVARFFAGIFGSTGSTMVGGTIADLWGPKERGFPMSIFSFVGIGTAGISPVAAGWIEQSHHLQWRWIQWISFILDIVSLLSILLFMSETRSAVLLTKVAKRMRKETGDNRYRARTEDERVSLRTLIHISMTRPVYLLLTEPVVASFSLWLGFVWGVFYALSASIGSMFTTLYSFNSGQTGTVYLSIFAGSILGSITSMYQEKLYKNNVALRGPEARLYSSCGAAFLVPIGMFILAWTAYPSGSWMAPITGVLIFAWGMFTIYLTAFLYLADVYGPFASSAIAGLSLTRNLVGSVFPLFIDQLLGKLGYTWGNGIFAFVAVALIPIPYVFFFYGSKIRARSKSASALVHKS